jgi:hypothetical protein
MNNVFREIVQTAQAAQGGPGFQAAQRGLAKP